MSQRNSDDMGRMLWSPKLFVLPPSKPWLLCPFADTNRTPVIVSAVRTPFGSLQGSLSSFSATQLGSFAIKGAELLSSGISSSDLPQILFACFACVVITIEISPVECALQELWNESHWIQPKSRRCSWEMCLVLDWDRYNLPFLQAETTHDHETIIYHSLSALEDVSWCLR